MKKNVGLLERRRYDVTLHNDERGELGKGTLHFGGNRLAYANFANGVAVLPAGERIEIIKAVDGDNRTYSLCRCKSYGSRVYADYVIESDVSAPEFDEIDVRYKEASEWFLHWQTIDGDLGEQLAWKNKSAPLSVTVSTADDNFTLQSDYEASFDRTGEDHVIHEHVLFTFAAPSKKFGLPDLRGKTHELSCLLSILIGCPVTTMTVRVKPTNGRFAIAHFPGYAHPEPNEDSSSWTRWFTQKPWIESNWQTIFDRYYQSAYRNVIWIRFAGMQRYDGFWEYKALGYVSLLDQYLTIWSANVPKLKTAPPTKKLAKLRTDVATSLPALSAAQLDTIIKSAENVFWPKYVNFADRFNAAMATTDSDIRKIIALSGDDFEFIKDVRHSIAHGDDHKLKDDDYQRVTNVVEKVTLLLTYWAYMDFGLTKDDFIRCLHSTHHPMRLSSDLDRIHLARVTSSAEFFPVTEAKFNELKKINIRVFACFERKPDGILEFSDHYTKMYQDWNRDLTRPSGSQDPKKIFNVNGNAARCVGHGYFEFGDQRIEANHFWIIDPSLDAN